MDCVTTPEKRGPSIDTSKISTYRGRAIGRAFYNAYRFQDFLKWDAVAAKLGGNNTEDSVKKACYRFLKKV